MFIRTLTYSSLASIKKNYDKIYNEYKTAENLQSYLIKELGENQFIQSQFIKPNIKFYMPETKDKKTTDYENSILIYEKFSYLTESKASDMRFWAGYAIENDVYEYLKHRWGDTNKTLIYRVVEHAPGKRGLIYHGIARLWWFVHLTINEELEDKYEYTKFCFSYPHIMEKMLYRNFSNSKSVRLGIIKGIKMYVENDGFYRTGIIDQLYLHISLLTGVHLIDLFSIEEIAKIAFDFLNEIDNT